MRILTKIEPISMGVMYAMISLSFGIIALAWAYLFPPTIPTTGMALTVGTTLMLNSEVISTLTWPLLLIVITFIGFVTGIVTAVVYNLIAMYVGGVGVELD